MNRDWPSIIKFYEDDLSVCGGRETTSAAMLSLVKHLDAAGYVKAGLFGATSMRDLLLGQSRRIFEEPRLRVAPAAAWFHGPIICRISYESEPRGFGLPKSSHWHTDVQWDEIVERVERVLVKRLRWFKRL